MVDSTPTLFTRIINREIPAEILYEDDQCIVINDIYTTGTSAYAGDPPPTDRQTGRCQ